MTDLFPPGELPRRNNPRVRPVMMRDSDIIVLKELVHRSGYCARTLTGLGRKYGISRQLQHGSPLEFSWPAWIALQYGDHVALELLREGDRGNPYLARYFREAGVPI